MLSKRVSTPWHICIDTGGTFTDCIARNPDGELRRAKVLSSSRLRGRIAKAEGTHIHIDAAWDEGVGVLAGFRFRALSDSGSDWHEITSHDGSRITLVDTPPQLSPDDGFEVATDEPAPILAARLVTGTPANQPLPPMHMRLATTRGTNALLERAGAGVAFFVTRGFADLLHIGDQQRPDLFALNIRKATPLHESVVQVHERLHADGSVHVPLDEAMVRDAANTLVKRGITVAAIALLHSYRNDEHEQRVAAILREAGFTHVSCSAELAPLIEVLPRAETAVTDAYLSPVIESYVQQVRRAMSGTDDRLHIMTSAGGVVDADAYRAKDSLLSGPAGGVAGAAAAGRASGYERLIGFDMGGTSTDVARYDRDFEYHFEHTVGNAKLIAPALAIETVAAGGGSVCEFVDDRLRVGPRSAGADPGPACYGAGGPLTITDVNLLMGRLDAEQFEIPIDIKAAERALQDVADTVHRATSDTADADELLDGFLAIANERMAGAIAKISLRRGYDPAEYALVSFGGAGGQNACALAAKLNMRTVIMPRDASLLSAVGLQHAVVERFSQRQVLKRFETVREELGEWFDEAANQAIGEVQQEGIERDAIVIRRRIAEVRLEGQDATLTVEVDDIADLPDTFAKQYEQMYGHRPEGKPIEVESIRVVASSKPEQDTPASGQYQPSNPRTTSRTVRTRFDRRWQDVPAHTYAELNPGDRVAGPALIFDRRSSYVIESNWSAQLDSTGAIIAQRDEDAAATDDDDAAQPEVARLELFTSRLSSIAEDMGQVLQRTALSTNVKRRLDFSCGVLDGDGRLVVNAPHIPVHLGALGLCVRSVRDRLELSPGDVIVTNHPAFGGSHLPDITVITPVFDDDEHLLGYVASRAHHAELGGTRPGSMPPTATTLAEEGVVIEPTHLLARGESRFDELERLLRDAAHPSRAVADNLADLRAAVAANHRGAHALCELARQHGREEIAARMNQLRDRAARHAHKALAALPDGRYDAIEKLDDDSPLAVTIDIHNDRATIDFTGTASQHPGNLNATPAIVQSAVLYALRLMIGQRLPLNEGILSAVDITLPTCLLNPTFTDDPTTCPAVVGGNTETSQRLVDTLLKALELAACSQGTMNNVLFGNDSFGYYETVCGGCGAGPDFDGADAVHTHMTNTRITDPEIIEHRYPVRIEQFAVRPHSGGSGTHRGGNGVIRELTFLDNVALSILSQHRVESPYGIAGGQPGKTGRQRIITHDGQTLELKSIDQRELAPGDRLILETPGGGGYGPPTSLA